MDDSPVIDYRCKTWPVGPMFLRPVYFWLDSVSVQPVLFDRSDAQLVPGCVFVGLGIACVYPCVDLVGPNYQAVAALLFQVLSQPRAACHIRVVSHVFPVYPQPQSCPRSHPTPVSFLFLPSLPSPFPFFSLFPIRQQLRAAHDRQRSYADQRRHEVRFAPGDPVLLKFSLTKRSVRFGR